VPARPSVISVTGTNVKSSELVVATTSFPAPSGPSVLVVISNEIVVDLLSTLFVSLTVVCSGCSDRSTGWASLSTASVLSSTRGALVWVEVEMMEYLGGLDVVLTTGATGTIWSRELLGWPGPNTEIRGMEGRPVVVVWSGTSSVTGTSCGRDVKTSGY